MMAGHGHGDVKVRAVADAPAAVSSEDKLNPKVEEQGGFWVVKPEFRGSGLNPAEKVSGSY